MKKILVYLFALGALFTTGCTEAFDNTSDAKEVEGISLTFNLTIGLEDLTGYDMTLRLINYDENLEYSLPVSGAAVSAGDVLTVTATGVVPGIYTAILSGKGLTDDTAFQYMLSGNLVNQAMTADGQKFDIAVSGGKKGALVMKELYFSGVPSYYFRDQFYEIYNNTETTVYLDGLYFANLHPSRATTTLSLWPDDNAVYAERVWRFPGDGDDYPLQSGESVILAQNAMDHTANNPNSPVNLLVSDFEFYMGSTTYPDRPAFNMEHVFYNGKADIGTIQMWLVSVFGGAYCLFSVPDDAEWDPVGDPNMSSTDLATTRSTLYAKIPLDYVIDAVECCANESEVNMKRLPGVIDAGMTWVGNSYIGLGVTRRIETDEAGNPKTMSNGSYIYMDTNNSTDDFEREVTPEIRRNGAKMPSWNHTLQ